MYTRQRGLSVTHSGVKDMLLQPGARKRDCRETPKKGNDGKYRLPKADMNKLEGEHRRTPSNF
jgi:hypothetical protein